MTYVVLVTATVAVAWRTEAAAAAVPAAAVFTALVFVEWTLELRLNTLVLPNGPTATVIPEPLPVFFGTHLLLGLGLALLFGVPGYLAQGRSSRPEAPIAWAAAAVFAPSPSL